MTLLAQDVAAHASDLGFEFADIGLQFRHAEQIERQWLDPARQRPGACKRVVCFTYCHLFIAIFSCLRSVWNILCALTRLGAGAHIRVFPRSRPTLPQEAAMRETLKVR